MAFPDNTDLSCTQYEQDQQAAPSTPSMGFEAATAALDTNEILHLIIAEVPRQYRTKLRSVSKHWKAAVDKLGHAFDPPRPIGDRGPTCMLPMYGTNEFGKRLVCNNTNPAIACYAEDQEFECPGCVDGQDWCDSCFYPVQSIHARICFDPHKISAQEGEARELEFITDPPITVVEVSVGISRDWWSDGHNRQVSVPTVPGGIRVRDLKECFAKMRSCDFAYGSVASFAVLGQRMHEFCDPFPTPPRPIEVPTSLDNYRRSRFESEISVSQEEFGGGDTPYASEVYDGSQGEDGSFPPEQYGQSPPSQVYDAATATLDTNELLHLIIAEAPREYRTQLRRVSRAWKAGVEKLGHVIEPLEDNEHKDFRKHSDASIYHLPKKRFVCNKSNPMIRCRTEDTTFECINWNCNCDGWDGMQFDISFDPDGISGTPRELEWEDEFITDPPISQVHVACRDPESYYTRPVALYVRGGIRVRHLRDRFEQLEPSEYSSRRIVNFGVLGQYKSGDEPTEVCWWHLDDYSELDRYCLGGECQEETGGGDTPYASASEADSERSGDYGDSGRGEVGNDEPEDGYEWIWNAELEQWSYRRQENGSATGGGEILRATEADYHGQGDYGEVSLTSEEPNDGSEWNWEAEVKKWSKASQGDASESGDCETPPYANKVDCHGQAGDGEADWTTEELEGGREWNFEAELVKWSKLD